MEDRSLTTGWTEISDPASIFNPSTGEYTTPTDTSAAAGQAYVYEIAIAGSLSLNFNTLVRLISNDCQAEYRIFLRVSIAGLGDVKCYLPTLTYDDNNYYQSPTVISLGNFNEILTLTASSYGSSGVISAGQLQRIQIGVDITQIGGSGNNPDQIRWFQNSGGSMQTPNIDLNITSFNVNIRPTDNTPLTSGITTMNTFVPEKIKQSDYIKSIFMMYNLYATSDPNNESNLILLHRDEYYDSGKAVDWTNKLMKDKEQSIIFIPELNNKKLRLSYKADTDSPNTVYTNVTKEIYGQVEITFENEYVKGIDVKELLFSPTPVQRTVFGAFLPLLNGAAPKTNIRILFDNGQVTASNVIINIGNTTGISTGGLYPYLSHFGGDDPFNPTFDINFAECQYYYYQVAQNTNNNLYNKYWRRTVAQINGGKLMSAYFLLNEVDIQYMDLNDKIRIDNSWWSINKIIDYNANNLQPTKVELISLETEIDLPPFFGGASTPVGPGNGSQIAGIMQEYRSNTNVTTNNHDSIILGSGNVVGDGLRAMIVGDNLSIETDGIATTNMTITQRLNGRAVSDILPTYKKYIGLITQTSTNAPTVIELENTIGPIIWTRASTGVYYGTLTDMFPDPDKVYIMINQVLLNSIVLASYSSNDIVAIETTNLHSPTAAHHDSHLSNNTLEIRVYE
jgi:hypothetical protein